MNDKVTLQEINLEYKTRIEIAIKYFSIVLTLSDIHLPPRDLELLAFIAVRGTISSPSAKEEFIKQFDSTLGTIANMTSRLSKKKLIIKQSNKYRLNPYFKVNLTNSKYLFKISIKLKPDEISG